MVPNTKSLNYKEKSYSLGVGCRIKTPRSNFRNNFLTDSSELFSLLCAVLHSLTVTTAPAWQAVCARTERKWLLLQEDFSFTC